MNRIVVALAALFAIATFAPAARAHDCDPEDVADVEKCVRGVVKAPSLRRVLPPTPRPSAAAKEECDPDDGDFKECLRALKVPGVSRREPPVTRSAAPVVVEKKAPEKAKQPDAVNAAPSAATIASSVKPAKTSDPDAARLCQKYFANVGQLIQVPCSE